MQGFTFYYTAGWHFIEAEEQEEMFYTISQFGRCALLGVAVAIKFFISSTISVQFFFA